MGRRYSNLLLVVSLMLVSCGAVDPAAPSATASVATLTRVPRGPTAVPPSPSPTNTVTPTPVNTATPDPNITTVYVRGATPGSAHIRLGLGAINSRSVSPDQQLIAIGSTTGIYIFENESKFQLWEEPTRSAVEEVMWTADSKWIIARLFEWGNVLIWDARTGALIYRLEHNNEVASLEISHDGTKLAVGLGSHSLDDQYDSINAIALWDMQTGENRATWSTFANGTPFDHPVVDVEWSPDSRILAATVGLFQTALIDVGSGQMSHLLEQAFSPHSEVQHLRFSPDGSKLVTYTGEGGPIDAPGGDDNAYVWDVQTGELLFAPQTSYVVMSALWSPDSRLLSTLSSQISYGSEDSKSEVRVWDVETQSQLQLFEGAYFSYWSEDSQKIAVYFDGSSDGYWIDARTGAKELISSQASSTNNSGARTRLAGFAVSNSFLQWSPDNSMVASIPIVSAGPIIIWNIGIGLPTEILSPTDIIPEWVAHSDEHTIALSCDDNNTFEKAVFDAAHRLRASITMVESDPDVRRSPRNSTIVITDKSAPDGSANGAQIQSFYEEDSIICTMAFSPNSRFLAIGHMPLHRGIWGIQNTHIDDNYVTVWDVQTGKLVSKFLGHTGAVSNLYWASDSKWLASTSEDETALIWRIP